MSKPVFRHSEQRASEFFSDAINKSSLSLKSRSPDMSGLLDFKLRKGE